MEFLTDSIVLRTYFTKMISLDPSNTSPEISVKRLTVGKEDEIVGWNSMEAFWEMWT